MPQASSALYSRELLPDEIDQDPALPGPAELGTLLEIFIDVVRANRAQSAATVAASIVVDSTLMTHVFLIAADAYGIDVVSP